MIMYTNTSMVHMGIITHHSPLYEGNDQVVMAIQTFIIPLHSFNTSNTLHRGSLQNVTELLFLTVFTLYFYYPQTIFFLKSVLLFQKVVE